MTVDIERAERAVLTMAGKPASAALRDVRGMARQLVGHFVDNVVPCQTLPGESMRGEVTSVTGVCLEIAVGLLDGRAVPEQVQRLEHAAAQWAREGIPIDTIHHAIHEGFKVGLDLVVRDAGGRDCDGLIKGARLVVELLDMMSTAVSMAYVRELRAVISEHHTAVHTLTSALLGGHSTSTMARMSGISIAESYAVVAVALPPHPDERNPHLDTHIVARRKLRRLQAELAVRCGRQALSLLSTDGGTILIPSDVAEGDLDELIAHLSTAAEVDLAATCVESALPEDVPEAADRTHELLDLVQQLELPPRLYRFRDLALEYQLSRSGPGLEVLESLLTPLDDHPELMETLRVHLRNDLNRRRTARELFVHTNTVDYRLKRIAQLTGFDLAQPSGLWYLRSALAARKLAAPAATAAEPERPADAAARASG